jgi:hypothetical protein
VHEGAYFLWRKRYDGFSPNLMKSSGKAVLLASPILQVDRNGKNKII